MMRKSPKGRYKKKKLKAFFSGPELFGDSIKRTEFSVAKETAIRRMVYVGTGLVIAVAAFLAFMVIPRMAMHPEAVKAGSVRSSWIFVVIQLIVAAALLAFIIPNRHDIRKIKEFLVLAGIAVIFLSLMIFSGANYYFTSHKFYELGILMFICVGANLIAGILFITVPIMLRRSSKN